MRPYVWFAAWLVVGAGAALGTISVIGVIVLPVTTALAVLLATRRGSFAGIAGVVSGLGLPLLYVAYLNREGPGTVCRTLSGGVGESCVDEFSPWPWLVVGALFLVGGVAVFANQHRQCGGDSPL
jgi:hypothetical protein